MESLFTCKRVALAATFVTSIAGLHTAQASPQISPCPASFYSVALPDNARQCQRFDANIPASLVFFSPVNSQNLVEHFHNTLSGAKIKSTVGGRTLLTSSSDNVRVVISADNNGSQVDILVTKQPTD